MGTTSLILLGLLNLAAVSLIWRKRFAILNLFFYKGKSRCSRVNKWMLLAKAVVGWVAPERQSSSLQTCPAAKAWHTHLSPLGTSLLGGPGLVEMGTMCRCQALDAELQPYLVPRPAGCKLLHAWALLPVLPLLLVQAQGFDSGYLLTVVLRRCPPYLGAFLRRSVVHDEFCSLGWWVGKLDREPRASACGMRAAVSDLPGH